MGRSEVVRVVWGGVRWLGLYGRNEVVSGGGGGGGGGSWYQMALNLWMAT